MEGKGSRGLARAEVARETSSASSSSSVVVCRRPTPHDSPASADSSRHGWTLSSDRRTHTPAQSAGREKSGSARTNRFGRVGSTLGGARRVAPRRLHDEH